MPHPGQMLGDRYRLDDRIAAGGMGEVWQATDTVLGRDVAVKTLHAGRAADAGFQNRFRHEARAMAVLHHPGVADVYDYGQTGDGQDAYIVMARVRGRPLNAWIAEQGRLTAIETMSIVAQAGRALQAAHEAGIVHRDVKPSNLIVRPDGTVVLVDFGVARSAESAALTGAREVVGTALYIAPEQVSKRTTGPAADVYALGAVAYHCLAGRPPFDGPNAIAVAMQHLHDDPPALPPEVPEPVRRLVATALAKDPAQRFPSAAAMADAADAARTMLAGPLDSTAALAAALDAPLLPGSAAAAAATGRDEPTADGTAHAPATGATRHDLAAAGTGQNRAVGSAAVASVRPGGTPIGSHTAVLADLPLDEPPPGNRRRLLVVLAAVLVALATTAAVLALTHGWGGQPGGPGSSASAPASLTPSATTRGAGPGATAPTRSPRSTPTSATATTAGASPTPSPRPSRTSPTEAPTTAPAAPPPTSAGASAAAARATPTP